MGFSEIVETQVGSAGSASTLLALVYDETTGTYCVPQFEPDSAWVSIAEEGYRGKPTARPASIAVIDTGVVSGHPLIASRLKWAGDFTQANPADPEDRNGHGSVVALLVIMASPPNVELYSLKALGDDGVGTEEAMIAALDWVAEHGINIVNISAGFDRECDGSCRVCAAAERAAKAGCKIVAAAGNRPGTTMCPGALGVHRSLIETVEAWSVDHETNDLRREDYSGIGTRGGRVPGDTTWVPCTEIAIEK